MNKFFEFFTKKKRKGKSFSDIPFDSLSVQVYRNYEFDSENSLVSCADSFTCGSENKLKTGLNLSEVNSKSQLVSSDLKNASNEQKSSLEKSDKSRKNKYEINIRNCKYFHIGSLETINGEHIKKGWSLPVNLDLLLDCHQKISEESIVVISLHMGDSWKRFGTSLGLEDDYLEEVKWRNDGNTIIMTFDILQKYIGLFPNTSVGFIISVLNDIEQMKIIRELAKNKNLEYDLIKYVISVMLGDKNKLQNKINLSENYLPEF